MSERKRGQKICSKCNTANGVRAYECKSCGTEFQMKKARKGNKNKPVEDYRTLNKGDLIRVVGGSGCYYKDSNGEKHYFTDRGKYKVMDTDDKGIIAVGKCGHQYIYMGKFKQSRTLDTCWDAPHKIILLKLADPKMSHSIYGSAKRRKSRA